MLPHVVLDVARHADEYAALQEEEYAAYDADAHVDERQSRETAPRHDAVYEVVNGDADDAWLDEADGDRGEYADDPDDERPLVRAEVPREFSQIVHERDQTSKKGDEV